MTVKPEKNSPNRSTTIHTLTIENHKRFLILFAKYSLKK